MSRYAVRFNYPQVRRHQPTYAPGFAELARVVWVVPEMVVGHVQVWDNHAVQPVWETLCQAALLGKRKIVAKHLAGREVCPACLAEYTQHPDYPDNELLRVWREGGTKVFA